MVQDHCCAGMRHDGERRSVGLSRGQGCECPLRPGQGRFKLAAGERRTQSNAKGTKAANAAVVEQPAALLREQIRRLLKEPLHLWRLRGYRSKKEGERRQGLSVCQWT